MDVIHAFYKKAGSYELAWEPAMKLTGYDAVFSFYFG